MRHTVATPAVAGLAAPCRPSLCGLATGRLSGRPRSRRTSCPSSS